MKRYLREKVYEAYTIAYSIYNKNKNRKSLNEIKMLIKEALNKVRFNNGRGYYFIFSTKGIRILYPLHPEKEGENIINLQDATGKYMIKGMIKLIRKRKQGFYEYVRPHPYYHDKYYKKISFIKLFEPFNWIIGTGEYFVNFERKLKEQILEGISKFKLPPNIGFVILKDNKILIKNSAFNIKIKNLVNHHACQFWQCKKNIYYKDTIPNWKWEIITFYHLSALKRDIKNLTNKFTAFFLNIIIIFICINLIFIIILIIFSRKLSLKMTNEVNVLKNFFNKIPEKFITIEKNYFLFEEFRDLSKYANEMSRLLKKQAEIKDNLLNEILKERNYTKFIIENIGIGIVILDKNKHIEFANEIASKIFQMDRERFYTLDLCALIHNSDEVKCPICYAYNNKKSFSVNYLEIELDGKLLFISLMATPVIFENNLEKIIIAFKDISENINNRLEIEKLKRAINQAPVSIVITDINGTIEYVNPFFSEITGYSFEEAIGNNPRILKTSHNDKLYKDLWSTIKNGKPWEGEFLNKKKNGELYWEKAFIGPVFNNKGEIINFVAVKQDITQLKKIQTDLENTLKQLEISNKVKSEFLANMSHEIRTPMNAIIGFIDLLLDTEINETQKRYLELLKNSSKHLLRILNDILDLSKLEAGKMEFEETNFSLRRMIQNEVSIFSKKASEKNIKLKFNIENDVPDCLIGDETRISQVIKNLLNNAIKFTEKGEIGINVSLIYKNTEKCKIEFEIYDTGIGIPEDKIDNIFNAFSQADSSITRKFGGTGLGLTISTKIVKAYNGDIWVKSIEGKGSKFFFTLELKYQKNNLPESFTNEKTESNEISFENAKVLVVEDNKTNQILIGEILKKLKINADFAENGIKAVEKLSKKNYDIILMDWHMPEMDGVETVEFLRDIEKGKLVKHNKIPYKLIRLLKNKKFTIIGLTAAALIHEKEFLLEKGFDDYLSKPVNKNDLIKILKKYLNFNIDKFNNQYEIKENQIQKLNLEYLKTLVGDDKNLIEKIINSFKKTFKESIDKMKQSLEEKNCDEIKTIAHTLKGAAANIGINDIAIICQLIEDLTESEDITNINKEIEKLINYYKEL